MRVKVLAGMDESERTLQRAREPYPCVSSSVRASRVATASRAVTIVVNTPVVKMRIAGRVNDRVLANFVVPSSSKMLRCVLQSWKI